MNQLWIYCCAIKWDALKLASFLASFLKNAMCKSIINNGAMVDNGKLASFGIKSLKNNDVVENRKGFFGLM